jgi:hypothetical protein
MAIAAMAAAVVIVVMESDIIAQWRAWTSICGHPRGRNPFARGLLSTYSTTRQLLSN